jgi:predicted GIY-YIG superfamily endonuclease
MADVPSIIWPGSSGQKYEYWIFPIETIFKNEPGNYIFSKELNTGYWSACYIGQTENLNQRLGDHEKEACARRNGATHIHAHLTSGGETIRKAEERDLIQKWTPPCNEQLT